ncbi:phosphonate ABC transporter substrate-binding protein [Oceanobacillus piezotolerans]|uniref:Phosphonate ABC transporter substrate-binding protein n=1 Tax=Oceanobacillus piezotolerans TaxID=2448030 RepID=A0A498D7Q9_9BACI|nr:PhnD/SsuA/transferrin family substrate-binding protein [Oceanobacillus piezotolerans]RLL43828.1 phosphonate ABC transporter substrate-binding protein [Oceanobacillus piezotolerans]
MKTKLVLVLLLVFTVLLTACSGGNSGSAKADDVIKMVWYPNESGQDMKSSRDEIGRMVSEATGKEVEHQLTTDYSIAIETLVNNNADLAFTGAQAYVEANKRNDAVRTIAVKTGESGTLDDAMYYSWLAVNKDEQDKFKENGEFSLDKIADTRFSFVSNSSTSGFKVPAASIIDHFSQQDEYADLTEVDLMESGTLFSQVLFGNSHQGSAVNLLSGNADVAAFCDTCVEDYVELADGEENTEGAVYTVKEGAAEPFNTVEGKEFTLMNATPVLNEPFVVNMDVIGQEDFEKVQEVLTSVEFANNEKIFAPEGSDQNALFTKSGDERLLPVEDEWYDPIREMAN